MDILSYLLGYETGKSTGGGSGGGGGGSLSAGVYWEQITPTMPLSYFGKHFVWKDELYLWQKSVSSGSKGNIYKLVDGEYTLICAVDAYGEPHGYIIPFGDLVHFIHESYHYVFDGTAVTKLSNPPQSLTAAFVYNGELIGVPLNSSYPARKWVSDTDTWEEATDFNGAKFVYNGELYRFYLNKQLQKLVNGEYVLLHTAPVNLDTSVSFVGHDGCLYIPASSVPGPCYKFDSVNNTFTEAFTMPAFSSRYYFYEYNGEIRVGGGIDNAKNHMRMHMITD